MLKTIEQVEERLNNRKCRSAWDKGVNAYVCARTARQFGRRSCVAAVRTNPGRLENLQG